MAAHPDAEIYLSQPGIGQVTGARVLAEFGDDPHRYASAKARKNYAGPCPDHPAPARARSCWPVHPQQPPSDALHHQALGRPDRISRRARLLRRAPRPRSHPRRSPAPVLGNRLAGILHGCLKTGTRYDEATAWPHSTPSEKNQNLVAAA